MFISLATFIAIEQKLQTYVKTHGHNQSLSSTLKDGQTKLSANHARVNTIAYGKPIPTASGHRMSFEWTSPDGKDKKEGIALVDYPTKSVFVASEGTPILSNFSLCPTAVNFSNESGEVLATHEFGTSEALYKLLNALVFDGFKGCDEAVGKIINANQMQDIANSAIEAEDHHGIISDGAIAPMDAAFQQAFMWAPGLRIAGGTDEILKNIIAERVLGLPQDIRVDKDVAYKDLPTGR